MKRMDALSKLGNTSDTHRLEELSSALERYSVLVSNGFFVVVVVVIHNACLM